MRENRLVWLAVTLAVFALVNSVVVGYFGLHSHDDFLKVDDPVIYSLPIHGGHLGDILDETGSGILEWVSDSTIHSEEYGSYPAEVPFTQGMTIMPGQRAKLKMEWVPVDTTK